MNFRLNEISREELRTLTLEEASARLAAHQPGEVAIAFYNEVDRVAVLFEVSPLVEWSAPLAHNAAGPFNADNLDGWARRRYS